MSAAIHDLAYQQDIRAMRRASNPRAVQTIRRAMRGRGQLDAQAERVATEALDRLLPRPGADDEGYCWTCGNDFATCGHGPSSPISGLPSSGDRQP